MALKQAVRGILHNCGGLSALRLLRRDQLRVLMFHEFHEPERKSVEKFCQHIRRYFQPVSLAQVAAASRGEVDLPAHALAVTVDDGYHNFLEHGHPLFRKYEIPTTIYAVAGFANGDLWLWTDQIAYLARQTTKPSLRIQTAEGVREFDISSDAVRRVSVEALWEDLKLLSNRRRIAIMASLVEQCGVELPALPPAERRSLTWDELRQLASEGVEIGCHTYSHPILSRLETQAEVESETSGARDMMELNLGFPVNHFCYPNGRVVDIGPAAEAGIRRAGFQTSVTCTWGLNRGLENPFLIRRVPFDASLDFRYGTELLVGLHL